MGTIRDYSALSGTTGLWPPHPLLLYCELWASFSECPQQAKENQVITLPCSAVSDQAAVGCPHLTSSLPSPPRKQDTSWLILVEIRVPSLSTHSVAWGHLGYNFWLCCFSTMQPCACVLVSGASVSPPRMQPVGDDTDSHAEVHALLYLVPRVIRVSFSPWISRRQGPQLPSPFLPLPCPATGLVPRHIAGAAP